MTETVGEIMELEADQIEALQANEATADETVAYIAYSRSYDLTDFPGAEEPRAVFTNYMDASDYVKRKAREFASTKILEGSASVSVKYELNVVGDVLAVVTVNDRQYRFYFREVPLNPQS